MRNVNLCMRNCRMWPTGLISGRKYGLLVCLMHGDWIAFLLSPSQEKMIALPGPEGLVS